MRTSKDGYGQIGFTSLLHTWGSNLWIHPYVHMIVKYFHFISFLI
ncbi:transposase [[Clostridium] spiroforme]|nr:transposase [Thomasclavelia spiroformis]